MDAFSQRLNSGATMHVLVNFEAPEPPGKPRWPNLLLLIPERWLNRWMSTINLATGLMIGAYLFVWLIVGGWRWTASLNVTSNIGFLIATGWLPLMLINTVLNIAQNAHAIVHVETQQALLKAIDDDLSAAIAEAVAHAVSEARRPGNQPMKGATIQ